MVAAGSGGRTLERLLALLGAQDIDEIKSSASEMMAAAAAGCGGGRRSDEGGDDLANEVVKQVNSWAEEASKGLITNLLQPQLLSPQTAIVLANGLYFKGMWTREHRFDESLTKKRTFYLLTGDTVSIPFMTSDKIYHYKSFDTFKVLKVPYKSAKLDRKFSMYFFLPHEKVGLQNLLEELCSDSGFLKQDYFDLRKVSLAKFWIPKFKLSYEFDIAKTMKKIGMTFPFIENPKDFSEMMKIPKAMPFLATSMTQKVVINLDEKGIEAVAVTRASFRCLSYKRSLPKPSFVADHPFLFMIKEKMSGLFFFMGAVLNPSL
ncbi:hypothetical protein RHMOL_Rhmol05G0117300 [Rhododendron molle]|uniref:Uncharacterized protein n=1 Tax=Rhododendron molle TaxID=49168 RepID=A0ACC0NNA0_RHOML|nr:hypothetical protein RHMOL_Rhmol05G0117300 [Rhododendron molle]